MVRRANGDDENYKYVFPRLGSNMALIVSGSSGVMNVVRV
jgi:hypothetical protein